MQTTKSSPSIERALAIMETLDLSRRTMTIAELGRRLNIPRSTAHVITLTLERCGYLTRDVSQQKYQLSVKAFHLGRANAPATKLATAAFHPMRYLSTTTQLTSHLAVLDQDQVTYVQKIPGSVPTDTHIGRRTNLHCTAVGKALLSYAPKAYQHKILTDAPFARYTRNTITSPSQLREELAKIAVQGYAVNNQEEKLEVRCLAVPIFSSRGSLVAALSISGAVSFTTDWMSNRLELLRRIGGKIGQQLPLEEDCHAI
jgi:DNA-binding IclR family transcriptional regulator